MIPRVISQKTVYILNVKDPTEAREQKKEQTERTMYKKDFTTKR